MGGQVWHPQCWVRIQIRFEDYLKIPPVFPADIDGDPLLEEGDPINNGRFNDFGGRIIPTQCSVSLRSYREADECRVTIPYGKLPFDPRTIRAASVQVYMGSIENPGDFADSMGPLYGQSTIELIAETPDIQIEGEPVTNEIFRGFADDWKVSQDGEDTIEMSCRDITAILIDTSMPIQGLAGIPKTLALDEVIKAIVVGEEIARAVPQDKEEKRSLRIESRRDVKRLTPKLTYNTAKLAKATAAFLLDQDNIRLQNEVDRLNIKQTQLINDLGVATIIAETGDLVPVLAQRYGIPGLRGLGVVNNTGRDLPLLGDIKGPTYFDSNGTAKKSRSAGSKERISYWDFITDLCVGSGFICYMRTPIEALGGQGGLPPSEIVIDLPNTYYKANPQELRQFVYGHNVDSLDIQRNYRGKNVPTGIVIKAIEQETGSPISVRFPEISNVNRPGLNPIGIGDRVEYDTYELADSIPGSNAIEILRTQAQSIYEQISRGEMTIDVETTTLAALPSNLSTSHAEQGSSATDMFQLRPGDPITIGVNPTIEYNIDDDTPQFTTAGRVWAMSVVERTSFFAQILAGGDESKLASVGPTALGISTAMDNPLLQNVFYTREVNIDFDFQTGFKFSVSAVNYLDSRNATTNQVVEGINATREFQERLGVG